VVVLLTAEAVLDTRGGAKLELPVLMASLPSGNGDDESPCKIPP
jgi:hypothetical protein